MSRTRGPPSDLAIVVIIPARFGSTRLPGKPLADIHGKTMIERVYERARAASLPNRVLVATDDERIAAAVRRFGGEGVLPSSAHVTATDRLARAALARGLARKHVGLYAYRRAALLRFAALPPSPLELAEGLEQLRALHHGMCIRVIAVDGPGGVAVDTAEDLERVRGLLAPIR